MRTFVAVEVSDEKVLDSIAQLQKDLQINASQVSRQNMHFTLLFLGEITEQSLSDVKKALSGIAFRPIPLEFNHLGAFPNPKAPRVIWLGIDEPAATEMVKLAAQVERSLAPLGFRQDKTFKPHLTIFRIRSRSNDLSEKITRYGRINIGWDTVSELKLKQSVLTSNGPIYSDLLVVKAQ